MFNMTWAEYRELRRIVRLAVVLALIVAGILKVTWPYGHWVALVVGAAMLHLTQRALAPLGQGDDGPGGGFVEQRRRDLRGQRVLFGIVAVVGAGGALIELAGKLL